MTPSRIRWGILGTGNIAKAFAGALARAPDAEITAVGSRSRETALAFAQAFGVKRAHASYETLAGDPDVDVIYVSSPHSSHAEHTLLCLNAGKAVLCEKPLALNAAQAQTMIRTAREHNVFLMEAMWTRFFPAMERFRELVAEGGIGEPRLLAADFGFRTDFDPKSRLFDPALGGGALLDVGVYAVSLASMVFGSATGVTGLAHLGPTGVDEQAAMVLSYPSGQLAVLYTATRTESPQEATLLGTAGRIRIHSNWWRPERLTLHTAAGEQTLEIPYDGNGYHYEVEEVQRCLREGRRESARMPLDESLAVLRTMDALRVQWGVRYSEEQE
ncbi:MAG: Gfo/Idh/MocA family protein [Anaerolineales bacterium]